MVKVVSVISNDNLSVGTRNCNKCGLLELSSGPVDDDGTDRTILAVGEAPGEKEDLAGRPFVGQSGRLLRQAMPLQVRVILAEA